MIGAIENQLTAIGHCGARTYHLSLESTIQLCPAVVKDYTRVVSLREMAPATESNKDSRCAKRTRVPG